MSDTILIYSSVEKCSDINVQYRTILCDVLTCTPLYLIPITILCVYSVYCLLCTIFSAATSHFTAFLYRVRMNAHLINKSLNLDLSLVYVATNEQITQYDSDLGVFHN